VGDLCCVAPVAVSETSTPGVRPPGLDRPVEKSDVVATQLTRRLNPRMIITGAIFLAIIGLAIWYLARPELLLVQGEAESTRIDMAARVSGRLAISVVRGQDAAAGVTSLVIDDPELVAQLREAKADKTVADAELARIMSARARKSSPSARPRSTGPRPILTLAQQTYNRTNQPAAATFAPL
jgi:HlyD family secretion protein